MSRDVAGPTGMQPNLALATSVALANCANSGIRA